MFNENTRLIPVNVYLSKVSDTESRAYVDGRTGISGPFLIGIGKNESEAEQDLTDKLVKLLGSGARVLRRRYDVN